MTVRQPRYSKEEFARRGDEIYESQVRPQVEAGNYSFIPHPSPDRSSHQNHGTVTAPSNLFGNVAADRLL
jgi:hypothetical protein